MRRCSKQLEAPTPRRRSMKTIFLPGWIRPFPDPTQYWPAPDLAVAKNHAVAWLAYAAVAGASLLPDHTDDDALIYINSDVDFSQAI